MEILKNFFNNTSELIISMMTVTTSLVAMTTFLLSKRVSRRIDNEYDDTIFELKNSSNSLSNKELGIDATLINDSKTSDDDYNLEKDIEIFIKAHHKQAIKQASIQFALGIIASITGFVFILVVIVLQKDKVWYEYLLSLLPGAIIELVSVLFLNQTNAVRERSSDFLNRLREDNQISKAIIIADSIENETLKSEVKSQIAMHICGIRENSLDNKSKE